MSKGHRRHGRQQIASAERRSQPPSRLIRVSAARAVLLPIGFALLLVLISLLPPILSSTPLRGAVWAAAAALAVWAAGLFVAASRVKRALVLEVSLRKQHYLQACAQGSVLVYWGAYWSQVPDAALLIAAQLAFAYGVDALLAWCRRDTYTLGFGPFPVVFSTNLFLWFKPEWFYLQFLMIAVGFAAKELIRWEREGRRVHIFNPSSFTLAVFSVILILTGSTRMTWGEQIATTQLNPPHLYALIFLVALPGQLLFGVSSMTWSAVVTTYAIEALHFAITGSHLFLGGTI